MRFALFFSTLTLPAALFAGGCAGPAAPPAPLQAAPEPERVVCEPPRPQVCTMIYAPVCAEHGDGRLATHASACNACADDTVVAYAVGTCEGAPAS